MEPAITMNENNQLSRRHFLKGMAAAAVCTAMPGISSVCDAAVRQELSFYHTHTCETLTIPYPVAQGYERNVMDEINYFLRDFRTGDLHDIDPCLLDILYLIKKSTGGHVYEVISGYRSPATNRMLRRRSHGVARRSLHMKGKAIDIRLTGVNTMTLRNCALALKRGGVGYYRKSDFVHVDTGRFRFW